MCPVPKPDVSNLDRPTCNHGGFTRRLCVLALATFAVLASLLVPREAQAGKKLYVVATIPTYGSIAKFIVGDRGEVHSLAKGYEDPHFVRPKPSLAVTLGKADVLLSTGLDLELWLPALMDKASNPKIRSGQPGFVSVSEGLSLLEKPKVISRSEGGMHIYGNPHIYTGPLNGKIVARNIMIGLKKVDPAGADTYERNYKRFVARVDQKMYGKKLVKILGSKVLTKLTLSGKLISFLEGRDYKGKKLTAYLGGWMGKALPLRNRKIVAYHKNWAYFARTFGVNIVDYVEPKPGIPPSPGHVASVVQKMKSQNIKVILAANYYSRGKVKSIADKVGATPVIVALSVGGEPGMNDYFAQYDIWISRLVAAAK